MSSDVLDAILFDLDGTLVSSLDLWVEVFLDRFEAWGVTGFKVDDYFERVYAKNAALPDVLDQVGIGREHTDRFRAERDAMYEARLEHEARWIDGAHGVLETLHATMPLGIVTQAWASYVDVMDRCLGVRSYVDVVVTCEDFVESPKPDPYGLLLAAQRLDVDPARCAYVGDQPYDVGAAQRAGMTSVLIPRETTRFLPDPPADHTLTSIGDVLTLCEP